MLSFSANYFIVRRYGVARANKNVTKLQLVQNYACRIVAGLRKYDHVSEALKSLKWLNVRDKRLFNDLVMVYKCLKNLTPGYLHRRFQYRAKTRQRVTRQNKDLTLPPYRLATGQKTFSYRGAKLYNSIAKDIRDTGNFIAFKYLFLLLKCKLPWKLTFIIIYRNSLFYH